jgi:polyamine oxidase
MVTATGSFARRNEELSDEEVQAETMGVLREIYGASIPEPVDILVPRWTLDPLYRGSYSNWPLGALDEHHANLGQPITQGGKAWLHFTGEAMSDEYFGYVQGGWDQGLKTATAVASCLKGQCPSAEVYTALTTCEQSLTTIDRRAARRRGGTPKRHGSPGHH